MAKRTAKTEYERARDLLTRYLAMRDHSRYELEVKLNRRFPSELIESLLAQAEKSGLLTPPEELAAHAVENWQRLKKSRSYIEEQLKKRRLPLPPLDDLQDIENARQLIAKKFGPADELPLAERGKAYRYLKNRGFDDRCVRMVWHDWQDE